jgi:hypothetical protein
MAKTRPAGTAGTADNRPANGTASAPGPAAPRRSIFDLSRFVPSRVDRSAAQNGTQNGTQPAQERPRMFGGLGKLLFGYLIFLVVAQYAIPLALSFADSSLHLNLGTRVTADHNTPLLGGLTWYFALYIVLTLGVLIVLLRFNIIPRDPLGSRARMEAQRQARLNAAATPTGGSRSRSRAARRRAAASTTTAAAAAPAGRKGAKAEPTVTSDARRIVPKARDGGEHDDAYERVKAAQRLARRRAARR